MCADKGKTKGKTIEVDEKGMKNAYDLSAFLLKSKLEEESPEDLRILEMLKKENLVVVKGQYDKVEQIFSAAGTEYTEVRSLSDFGRKRTIFEKLNPQQVVLVNCPGEIQRDELEKLVSFVKEGGYLVTTDWALRNVIEYGFPKTIRFNGNSTENDKVKIEIPDHDNKYVKGMFSKDSNPLWWLENSSYPIEIVGKKIEVLITSREMQKKYKSNPIAVMFEHGDGKVFHVTSHFYLQQGELRDERQRRSGIEYAKNELKIPQEKLMQAATGLEGASLGAIESAYTSARFIYNILIDKFRST